jgi:hypothetical protein
LTTRTWKCAFEKVKVVCRAGMGLAVYVRS